MATMSPLALPAIRLWWSRRFALSKSWAPTRWATRIWFPLLRPTLKITASMAKFALKMRAVMAIMPKCTTIAVSTTWKIWKLTGSTAAGNPMRIQSGRITRERLKSVRRILWWTLIRKIRNRMLAAISHESMVASATPFTPIWGNPRYPFKKITFMMAFEIIVMMFPNRFHTVRPWVAIKDVRVDCRARNAKPIETICKKSRAWWAASPVSPIQLTIWLFRGIITSVIAMPNKRLPNNTIVWVVPACLGRSAPMNCEAMLAPAWANALIAIKSAPSTGINAPTPAAADSDVRDRNQLSIMGWHVAMPKVMNSGHERLNRERSLTCTCIRRQF